VLGCAIAIGLVLR